MTSRFGDKACTRCFFSPAFLLFALLPPMAMAFTCFLSFGFYLALIQLAYLTLSAILILLVYAKTKPENNGSPQKIPEPSSDNFIEAKASGESEFARVEEANLLNPHGSEDNAYEFELDSKDNYNVSRILTPSSNGSIPYGYDYEEEDNLIEISLPSQHLIEWKLGSGQPDLLSGFILEQHGTVELFDEMNDEDNLIELDISVGSVKCPGIEMRASEI